MRASLLIAAAALGVAACPSVAAALGAGVVGCTSDQDCIDHAPSADFRCIENTSPNAHACLLPGPGRQNSTCACGAPSCNTPKSYPASVNASATQQYLMIGDSISRGMHKDVFSAVAAQGVQSVHNPGNAANSNWGHHCLTQWLGPDPHRWDVVSFNWGLHDLALDTERLNVATYTQLLKQLVAAIIDATRTDTKLMWVSTTPVPSVPVHPPRSLADVLAYNKAAAGVMTAASRPIDTVDMYAWVMQKCSPTGAPYKSCSIQLPGNVHYTTEGWLYLATNMTAAVLHAIE